jgi:RNA polymerase sigma-70 factor (ECF subfamily)
MRTWRKNNPSQTGLRPVEVGMGSEPENVADLDDDELVLRARRGESDAFAALVHRHRAWAIAYARPIVGPVLAEDAFQDAMERICRAIERYRPQGNFRGYLAKVLYRCCMDILRKGKPPGADPRDDELGAEDPFLLAVANRDLLKKAIASLDDRHREVIQLRYRDELSCEDVAKRTGRPLGTIKRELSEAYGAMYDFIMIQEIQ